MAAGEVRVVLTAVHVVLTAVQVVLTGVGVVLTAVHVVLTAVHSVLTGVGVVVATVRVVLTGVGVVVATVRVALAANRAVVAAVRVVMVGAGSITAPEPPPSLLDAGDETAVRADVGRVVQPGLGRFGHTGIKQGLANVHAEQSREGTRGLSNRRRRCLAGRQRISRLRGDAPSA